MVLYDYESSNAKYITDQKKARVFRQFPVKPGV